MKAVNFFHKNFQLRCSNRFGIHLRNNLTTERLKLYCISLRVIFILNLEKLEINFVFFWLKIVPAKFASSCISFKVFSKTGSSVFLLIFQCALVFFLYILNQYWICYKSLLKPVYIYKEQDMLYSSNFC